VTMYVQVVIFTCPVALNYTVVLLPPPQAFQKYKIGGKRTERPAD
jgi:hypothetical protein